MTKSDSISLAALKEIVERTDTRAAVAVPTGVMASALSEARREKTNDKDADSSRDPK